MKKISSLVLLTLASGSIYAAQISPMQAYGVASKYASVVAPQKRMVRAVSTTYSDLAPYYIFNASDGKGFVIVSGDDSMTELVGYSKSGYIDTDNMPDALKSCLDNYAQYVALVQDGSVTADKRTLDEATPVVAPLLKTNWTQTAPFNDLCPIDPSTSERSVVGCVATAMAQVCNYYKWPLKPLSFTKSYRCSNSARVSVDFSKSEYDWDNMFDEYSSTATYTDAQRNAVAKLSFDLGAAVNMDYSSKSSGTQDSAIPYALDKFGYKCQIYYREMFNRDGFIALAKGELNNARPVIFSGQGSVGGHCFVADGYDSNDYLHINWGWGGLSDSYFDIDAMNPSALGTGGGAGGFNYDQSIVTVEKDETMTGDCGQMPVVIYDGGYVQPQQSSLTKGEQLDIRVKNLANFTYVHDFNGYLAIAIYDSNFNRVALSSLKQLYLPSANVVSSDIEYTLKDELKNLSDGVYTIWAVTKEDTEGVEHDWIRTAQPDIVYMYVTGNTIEFAEPVNLSLASTVTADRETIYPGDKVKFTVVLNNATKASTKGKLKCEIRDVETGKFVTSANPQITLGGNEQVEVLVTMTILKAAVTVGKTYQFNVLTFNNGARDFEVASSVDPFQFVIGDAAVSDIKASGVSVYPNPTVGVVKVNSDEAVKSIEAYAADGRLAASATDANEVNLSSCGSGIYLVKVVTAKGSSVYRVVKK